MTKRLKKQAKPVVFLGIVIGCALIVSGVLGLSGHLNNQEAIKSKKKNQVSETKLIQVVKIKVTKKCQK